VAIHNNKEGCHTVETGLNFKVSHTHFDTTIGDGPGDGPDSFAI
jgi:hypothetical protein